MQPSLFWADRPTLNPATSKSKMQRNIFFIFINLTGKYMEKTTCWREKSIFTSICAKTRLWNSCDMRYENNKAR